MELSFARGQRGREAALAKRVRVLIIDDNRLVREGLEAMLTAQPDLNVVAVAADMAAGLRYVREFSPQRASPPPQPRSAGPAPSCRQSIHRARRHRARRLSRTRHARALPHGAFSLCYRSHGGAAVLPLGRNTAGNGADWIGPSVEPCVTGDNRGACVVRTNANGSSLLFKRRRRYRPK